MGFREFLTVTGRVLKLSRKSDRHEYLLYLRLVLLGVGVVGAIGFMIQLIASLIKLSRGAT